MVAILSGGVELKVHKDSSHSNGCWGWHALLQSPHLHHKNIQYFPYEELCKTDQIRQITPKGPFK